MKTCSKCGAKIPDDSVYCEICGERISEETVLPKEETPNVCAGSAEQAEEPVADKAEHASPAEAIPQLGMGPSHAPEETTVQSDSSAKTAQNVRKTLRKTIILRVAAAVLFAVLLAGNIIQHYEKVSLTGSNIALREKVTELQDENAELANKNTDLENEKSVLTFQKKDVEADLSSAQKIVDRYESIVDFYTSTRYGKAVRYESSKFYLSDSVVVVHTNTKASLTLTGYYYSYYYLEGGDDSIADVSWASNRFDKNNEIKIIVKGIKKGVTTVSVTNENASKDVEFLIIVY